MARAAAAVRSRASSGTRSTSGRPIISSARQPKSRVAPSFQYVTIPSMSVTITESRTLASRCASRANASSARFRAVMSIEIPPTAMHRPDPSLSGNFTV